MANNSSRSVLVVEDDAELNRLVGAYVSLCGFKYLSAFTGGEALQQAAGDQPSLVLLDLMLPDVDGYEVCRRLRSSEGTRQVPIVIVSALSSPQDIQRGRECGADDYLTKPVAPERLLGAIRHYAGGNGKAL